MDNLSKGKRIIFVFLLILLILVVLVWIWLKLMNPAADKESIVAEENALRITNGSDIQPFSGLSIEEGDIYESSFHPQEEPSEPIKESKSFEFDNSETNRASMNTVELIKDLENELKEKTGSDLWFYGTLDIPRTEENQVVVIDYDNCEITPADIYLYNPSNDELLKPSYFNDNKDGRIVWEIDVLSATTYGVMVNLSSVNESIGEYTIYNINKDDYNAMEEYSGMLEE